MSFQTWSYQIRAHECRIATWRYHTPSRHAARVATTGLRMELLGYNADMLLNIRRYHIGLRRLSGHACRQMVARDISRHYVDASSLNDFAVAPFELLSRQRHEIPLPRQACRHGFSEWGADGDGMSTKYRHAVIGRPVAGIYQSSPRHHGGIESQQHCLRPARAFSINKMVR